MSSTTSSETHEENFRAVFQLHGGTSDGAEVIFEHNGKRISVSVFSGSSDRHNTTGKKNTPSPIEDHMIALLNEAIADNYGYEYDDIIAEALDIILAAGKSILDQVAPPRSSNKEEQEEILLHSLLYPKTLKFRFQTNIDDGKPVLLPIHPSEANTINDSDDANFERPGVPPDFQLTCCAHLPQYSSTEIRVLEKFYKIGIVCRVQVNDDSGGGGGGGGSGKREMLCKAHPSGLHSSSLHLELTSLQNIEKAFFSSSQGSSSSGQHRQQPKIRVPRLLGFVKHPVNGHIIGLLREWIPGVCLSDAEKSMSSIKRERRQKWAAQIRETVDQLHEVGMVWGDGKAENVVVDERDDAWLIDFGGSFTGGWVDEELAGTVEGDEMAVGRIGEFLRVGDSSI